MAAKITADLDARLVILNPGVTELDARTGIRTRKPLSEEHKHKLSIAQTGKRFSGERRKQISETMRQVWASGRRKAGWHWTLESRKRLTGRRSALGYRHSEETRKKMSEARCREWASDQRTAGYRHTDETKKKIGFASQGNQYALGYRHTGETKKKIAGVHIGNQYTLGYRHSEEAKKIIAAASLKRWQKDGYREKVVPAMLRAVCAGPNKSEKKLGSVLEKLFLGQWRYVGRGDLLVGGKCPDFANTNGQKKLIELFGDYWHRGQDPQKRIGIFKKFGFDMLVVWERELSDLATLELKLRTFHEKRQTDEGDG